MGERINIPFLLWRRQFSKFLQRRRKSPWVNPLQASSFYPLFKAFSNVGFALMEGEKS
jgi:hypothetical protein